ncbi:MAG: hypothetical protein MJ123_06235 [Lachnospiraceae bacterium]|nr:hypothetical protein [Lachnospiraceae bacterium]
MSNSIYKANFIQMSTDNVRVIDANALVAKKIEGYSALMHEPVAEEETVSESEEGFSSIDISDLVTDVITTEEMSPEESEEVSLMAQGIIDQANAEADEIKNAALAEVDSIKNEAYEEGRLKGYEDGMEAANKELMAAREELEKERLLMLSQFEADAKEVEPKLVDAITRIYERVFSDNFYNHKDVVIHLIHSALMNSDTDNGGAILVSEEDFDFVEESKEKVLSRINNASEWEIKVSAKLSKGQAKIETSKGLIDCGIDTQLKELSRTLHVLSYEE